MKHMSKLMVVLLAASLVAVLLGSGCRDKVAQAGSDGVSATATQPVAAAGPALAPQSAAVCPTACPAPTAPVANNTSATAPATVNAPAPTAPAANTLW